MKHALKLLLSPESVNYISISMVILKYNHVNKKFQRIPFITHLLKIVDLEFPPKLYLGKNLHLLSANPTKSSNTLK